MSKKLFKRLMEQKTTEFRRWANRYGLTFKTTSEIEREKAARERELSRLNRQNGDNENYNERRGNGRGNRNHNRQRR